MKNFTVDILWNDGRCSKYLCRAKNTQTLLHRIQTIVEGRLDANAPSEVFQINVSLFQGEVVE